MLNQVERFEKLVDDVKVAQTSINFSKLTDAEVKSIFLSFIKIPVCKKCKGTGRRAFSSRVYCHICGGVGATEIIPVTVEEAVAQVASPKLTKKLQAKIASNEVKQEKIRLSNERVENAKEQLRQDTLASMDEKTRKDFVKAINSADNSFSLSVKMQWLTRGYVSPAQINAMVKSYRDKVFQEAASEFYDDYKAGQLLSGQVKITEIEELWDENIGTYTRIVAKLTSQQKVYIRTNSKKLIDKCLTFKEADSWIKMTGSVKWVSDNKSIISVTSKGLMVEGLK